jgi:hypothetical protein
MKNRWSAVIVAIFMLLGLSSVPALAQRDERARRGAPAAGQAQRRNEGATPAAGQSAGASGRAVSRAAVPPRAAVAPSARVAPRVYPRVTARGPIGSRVYVEPRVYGYARPRAVVPVVVYPRPYYVFRPRFPVGYGLYVGVPIPYPVAFSYPTYVWGYPAGAPAAPLPAPLSTPPPQGAYGGIAFEITPDNADVAVDGVFVGVARDFSPNHEPLTLTPGRHHIELQGPGLEPLAFDVDVIAGEVIPYRGALQPR